MLRQDIISPASKGGPVQILGSNFCLRCHTFEIFKAVGRHQDRSAGFIQPVIGAPYPLQQPADPLWRTDLDHQIHIRPVQPEIE